MGSHAKGEGSRRVRFRRALVAVGAPLAAAAVVTASFPGLVHVRVRPGDTLWALAIKYHTTVARLIQLNHLSEGGNLIYAGQTLEVPGSAPRPASAATTTYRLYRVVPGDNVDRIAARFHVSPPAIEAGNHLSGRMVVFVGQQLRIPVAAPARATSTSVGPSRLAVRDMLISTAHRFGVDPALVLAVSWQESGWNQHELSVTHAIGAMQVEPYTGAFIGAYLLHRPLNLYSAADNIEAGVALLALLTREAATPTAVAGYYQGLTSVESHGMLPQTRRYVADVLALRARFAGA